jgi:hypothetical protein
VALQERHPLADEPPNKDQGVIERTCRIVMNVRVRISEITSENVAGYFTPDETGEGLPWEWAARQNRLLLALLQNEEVLERFLAHIVRNDLGFLLDSKRITGLSDEAEDELFEKVYSEIDSEDRVFFEEARKDGILYQNIELIHKAVVTDWKETDVIDLFVMKQDKAQEGAKLSDEIS